MRDRIAEAGEDLQHLGRAGRRAEIAAFEQLVVDQRLFGDAQAVGHLDHADAVEERLVVLVVLELLPFRFVGMGEDDALIGQRAEVLGAGVVAFLRRGQQRMQHLDRRLEHFDEFEQPLGRAVEAAGIAVGVGIVLREMSRACGCRPCRPAPRCPGCSRRRARSWRRRSAAACEGYSLTTVNLEMIAVELVEPLGRPGRADAGRAGASGCL